MKRDLMVGAKASRALWVVAMALWGCAQEAPRQGVGSAALDYLRSDNYPNLVIEMDWVEGHKPPDGLLEKVRQTVESITKKSGAVTLVESTEIPPGDADVRYSLDDIKALEVAHREHYSGGDTAALYVILVDGRLETDTDSSVTFGLAYSASATVIFHESEMAVCEQARALISDPDEAALLCPTVVGGTWIHEFGHIIGLVNNGIPMVNDHQDPEHSHHDVSADCIMNRTYETGAVMDFISAYLKKGFNQLKLFDAECMNDIEAAQR